MSLRLNLIAVVLLYFADVQVKPFRFGDAGRFYMINEGFSPKKFENEFVKFETCLEPSEENYLDKRIYGVFVIKKKLEHLGMEATMYRESNNVWLKSGTDFKFDRICNMPYSMRYFEESFTGKWDKETCTLDKGTYYVRNYTLENDIKNTTPVFPFGHFKFAGTLLSDIEGKRTRVAASNVSMWTKDEKNKKYETRPARSKKGSKCDKYE